MSLSKLHGEVLCVESAESRRGIMRDSRLVRRYVLGLKIWCRGLRNEDALNICVGGCEAWALVGIKVED